MTTLEPTEEVLRAIQDSVPRSPAPLSLHRAAKLFAVVRDHVLEEAVKVVRSTDVAEGEDADGNLYDLADVTLEKVVDNLRARKGPPT